MIRDIVKDEAFLSQKAEDATLDDVSVAEDLVDTLKAHSHECVGLAANMIGVNKRIIAFYNGQYIWTMFNPEIIKTNKEYEAVEG
ncbi:MAG: peptide deformylase, partial [Succinivibrio sp.]|nr:peptide deformylase [Succinivibrio sp.]